MPDFLAGLKESTTTSGRSAQRLAGGHHADAPKLAAILKLDIEEDDTLL